MTATTDLPHPATAVAGWDVSGGSPYAVVETTRAALSVATDALKSFTQHAGDEPDADDRRSVAGAAPSERTAAVGVLTTDLGRMCGELLRLRALAEAAAAAVLVEAVQRGVVAESASVDPAGWLRDQAGAAGIGLSPSVAAGFATVATQARRRGPTDLRPLADAVVTGRVPVATAKLLGRELDLLARRVPDGVWHTAAGELLDWAAQGATPADLRTARHRIAATYGTGAFEAEQATAHRHRELTGWVADDAGG